MPACCRFYQSATLVITLVVIVGGLHAQSEPPNRAAALEHFEKHVRPLLIAKCYACHSVEKGKSKGGLTLDTKEGWQEGGDSGPALVPGKPDESLLIKAVRYGDDLKMPPKSQGGRLTSAEIAALEKWVRDGAVDPRTKLDVGKQRLNSDDSKTWWAFRAITSPAPPKADGSSQHPIDAFLVAKWAEHRLSPVPVADKRMLLRRATFDLVGLPPTPEEV